MDEDADFDRYARLRALAQAAAQPWTNPVPPTAAQQLDRDLLVAWQGGFPLWTAYLTYLQSFARPALPSDPV